MSFMLTVSGKKVTRFKWMPANNSAVPHKANRGKPAYLIAGYRMPRKSISSPTPAGVQITASLCSAATVSVTIINLAGRTVAVVADRDLPQGDTTLLWNRRSAAGTVVPSGQYVVRVIARGADGNQTQAMAAVRLP